MTASWFFCRLSLLRCAAYSPLPLPSLRRTVRAFLTRVSTTPFADFSRPVRMNHSTLSHDFVTNRSSPEVSSTAFSAQLLDLHPVPLMDVDFAVVCPLVRHRLPRIQFLSIDSRLCSTLLSDPASRRRPCVSLSLHLHQVVKRTFTSKLLNMLGTQTKGPALKLAGPRAFLRANARTSFSWR
jgi:hypothetical protein